MNQPVVAIAHQTIIEGDAIGNDICGMYKTLLDQGYNVGLIAEFTEKSIKQFQLSSLQINQFLKNKDAVLIYHQSINWEWGEELLKKFKGKVIFKYHNITPARHFKAFSSVHYGKCLQGSEQTKRFINTYKKSKWMADSIFNSLQLHEMGLPQEQTIVVPPFNRFETLEKIEPDYKIIESLISNRCNNVLFVGRVAPNKGHVHLIKTIKIYKELYDPNVHLWIVGSIDHDQLKSYYNQLLEIIRKYGLEKNISFVDKIPENAMKSYYLGCDEFLCMSEHEGFCVPVIEAQRNQLPVITYGDTALKETAGKNQIVLDELDYDFAASALYTIYTDDKVRKFCIKNGQANINSRFSTEIIQSNFLSAFKLASEGEYQ